MLPVTDPPAPSDNTPPWSGATADQVRAWYRQYLGRDAGDDEVAGWVNGGLDPAAVENAIKGSPEAKAFSEKKPPTTTPPPGPTPPPNPGLGDLLKPFGEKFVGLGMGPEFHAPGYRPPPDFTYADWTPPTYEQAQNEPGYAFARDEGLHAIENSAGAKGLLRSGGTLKDFGRFNVDFAQRNFQNVWDRDLTRYGTNRNNAADIYARNYTSNADTYDRLFTGATAEFASQQHNFDNAYSRAWDEYLNRFDQYKRWQDFTEGALGRQADRGLRAAGR